LPEQLELPTMKVVSLNVGLPRTVQWKGKAVSTGIFKSPVSGRIRLRSLDFDGDAQADLSVHGGPDKAAYVYASEHYAYWRRELPDMVLPWGIFGENLTTEGLDEDALQVGDRFRIGSAEVMVTQPRLPCFKLGLRFGRDDMVKRLLASGRLGFYFRVVTEGEIAAGDQVLLVERAKDSLPVSEVTRLYAHDKNDLEGLQRMVGVAALPEDWRDFFKEQIQRIGKAGHRPAAPQSAWTGFRPFILREKVRESHDVASFHLVPEDGQPLPSYLPGQFLTVRLVLPGIERAIVRSYSLSDAAQPDHYRLTIRRIGSRTAEPGVKAGLVSTHFHDRLAVGDRIEAKAPAGIFTIDATQHDRPVVLIGGGIGITPLLSMLNAIAAEQAPRETWLLYGVRDEGDYILRPQLETIARTHANIRLRVFYSRPAGTVDDPDIQIGHMGLDAFKRLLPSTAYDFYVCGPSAMMESVTRDLQAWGVAADRVHTEAFGPATVKQAVEGPASQPDCGFDVTFERSGVTAQWSRCQSPLLELAEEQSVAIDFGCRAGSCGTCVTRLLSGSVHYLRQPNAPLEANEILPCIAVPAEPLSLDA
jgi:MOSC domain-containing protein YiiM/ferredoxin-NADP reductase